MLANRWTWTFSYRRIPEFRRGRSRTRIHGICWLIYRRRGIRIDRSTGSFYFHRCERSNRSRQCRNHLRTQRQKLYNRSPFISGSFSGRKFYIVPRLIEFTVDSKYSSDHEPLSLEREIIYDWYHANYYRNNSFARLYRQICTNVYISSFYSNQLTFHRRHPLSK